MNSKKLKLLLKLVFPKGVKLCDRGSYVYLIFQLTGSFSKEEIIDFMIEIILRYSINGAIH